MTDRLTRRLAGHRLASAETARLVDAATADDLTRPTPCAGWDLADLVAHLTVQNLGFARAAAGERTTTDDWASTPVDRARFADDHRASVDAVIGAFADPALPGRSVLLPEVSDGDLPAPQAVAMHLVDSYVHGWDLARTLDLPFDPPDDLTDLVLAVTERIPNGPERTLPGAAFAPAAAPTPSATGADRILILLGRDPGWAPRS